MVLPFVEIDTKPVADRLDVCGAENQIVFVAAPVDSDAVKPPDAAKMKSCPVEMPVLPAVLPVLDTPKPLIADWFVWVALIVTVPPFAPVDCDKETMFEPTRTIWVPVIPVDPAVFPPVETPTDIAPAPRFGAEIVIVMLPAFVDPDNVMLLPPAKTSCPVTVPEWFDVLPPVDTPADIPAPPAAPDNQIVFGPPTAVD
jgi:hypothetical protein